MEYELMVEYTPQTQWIKGQGVFLWLAFFFSEVGAGVYLVSLFLDFKPGWPVGWFVTLVLGGLVHLGFLGHPMRAWRILRNPLTSEMSRGLWMILIFALFGFLQVAPVVFTGLPWTGDGVVMKTVMGLLCLLVIMHGFMTMGVVRALPLWNSTMIIPLSVASGIWVGSQAVEIMIFISGQDIYPAELWSRWSLLGYAAVLFCYLWGTYHSSDTARESVKQILTGDFPLRFYAGVLFGGIILPLLITLVIWRSDAGGLLGLLLPARFILVLIGDLAMRHIIMEKAVYGPML
jgi:hypothetical protein